MTIKVYSLNVHGLNSPFKRKTMWQEAKKLKGDILCIQDTNFSRDKQPKCKDKSFPHIFHACAPTKKCGTMIAINKSVAFKLHTAVTDPKGRYIILVCELNNLLYTIVNLYAPNTGQASFLKALHHKINKHKQGALLICGDFNCVVDTSLDCSSHQSAHRYELKTFLAETNLYVSWRCINSTERDYTYFSAPHNSDSRIDLMLSDLNILQKIIEVKIHAITWSDHAPVTITIREQNSCNPTYLWRNNVLILSTPLNQEQLSKSLKEYFQHNDNREVNVMSFWCAGLQ